MGREKDAAPSLDYVLWPDRASSYQFSRRSGVLDRLNLLSCGPCLLARTQVFALFNGKPILPRRLLYLMKVLVSPAQIASLNHGFIELGIRDFKVLNAAEITRTTVFNASRT